MQDAPFKYVQVKMFLIYEMCVPTQEKCLQNQVFAIGAATNIKNHEMSLKIRGIEKILMQY